MSFDSRNELPRGRFNSTFTFVHCFSQERCRFGHETEHAVAQCSPHDIESIERATFDSEVV